MARQASHYSTFLAGWAGLVGIPTDRITTELAALANTLFNTAVGDMWTRGTWLEICPRGEARFLGNRLTYPNNLTKTASWTATAVTLTANSVANPCDGGVTASKMMETAATDLHKVVQNVTTFFPSTTFTVSCYARPNGRNYVELKTYDGAGSALTAMFNISTGVVVSNTFTTATIGQQPNGFWLCQATFTSNATATTSGTYTVSLSSDGSTMSYAGDTAKGAYIWGNLIQQTSNVPVQDSTLVWDQTGENVIDAVFDIYATSPFTSNLPTQIGYNLSPEGIQTINGTPYSYSYYVNGIAQSSVYGVAPANPVFLYYRKTCPSYTGTEYSATATYAVDAQIYFSNSLGYGDYYKCIVATTAGQSPDTTAASWEVITFYQTFLQYCIYQAYGDWLVSDGQIDKAGSMYAVAQRKMDDEFDTIERLMGEIIPMRVTTHVTSRTA